MVTFVWPHKCETSSWAAFQLVSDLYFGMPSHYLAGFHSACLGRSGCYSMAYQDKAGWSHVTKPQGAAFDMLSFEGAKGVAQSGHSCYRCIVNLQKNATAFWQPESSTRYPGWQFSKVQSLACHNEPLLRHPDACERVCAAYPKNRCRAWTSGTSNSCTCQLFTFAMALELSGNSDTVRRFKCVLMYTC
jgi:hypothetical protein